MQQQMRCDISKRNRLHLTLILQNMTWHFRVDLRHCVQLQLPTAQQECINARDMERRQTGILPASHTCCNCTWEGGPPERAALCAYVTDVDFRRRVTQSSQSSGAKL